MPDDYFVCPNCGAEVRLNALACPECGSDESTGWSEDTVYDGIDHPEFNAQFDENRPPRIASPFRSGHFMIVVALLALLVFLIFCLL